MRKLLSTLIITLCLGACVPGHNDYSEYKDINPAGWRFSEILSFTPEHTDSIATGSLAIGLRHTNEYPYSNLYVEVSYDDASGAKHVDTLNIELADKFGRWQGKGAGTSYQIVDTVNNHLRHVSGHPVNVRHIMRVDTLPSIDLVGVIFTAR